MINQINFVNAFMPKNKLLFLFVSKFNFLYLYEMRFKQNIIYEILAKHVQENVVKIIYHYLFIKFCCVICVNFEYITFIYFEKI